MATTITGSKLLETIKMGKAMGKVMGREMHKAMRKARVKVKIKVKLTKAKEIDKMQVFNALLNAFFTRIQHSFMV